MCRLLAYKGQPVTLHKAVLAPRHSLEVQSYQPREMLNGTVNVDGFGCGWYNKDVQLEPGVYNSLSTLWADGSFRSFSKIVHADLIFSSVRSATAPSPVDYQSIQPFARGPYLFMHNGHINNFHEKVKRQLYDLLVDDLFSDLKSASDSAVMFALLFNKLRQHYPSLGNMEHYLLELLKLVTKISNDVGESCQLNIALTDGNEMIIARYSNKHESNSLYSLENRKEFPESVIIASEKLDNDKAWKKVPHNHLVTVNGEREVAVKPITF